MSSRDAMFRLDDVASYLEQLGSSGRAKLSASLGSGHPILTSLANVSIPVLCWAYYLKDPSFGPDKITQVIELDLQRSKYMTGFDVLLSSDLTEFPEKELLYRNALQIIHESWPDMAALIK